MINSYSLTTSEIDYPEIAVSEIMSQLAGISLCTHSVGIIVCHYDHVESDIVAALAKALPFPIVGFTTFYHSNTSSDGLFELSITVITSDDVRFSTIYQNISTDGKSPHDLILDSYQTVRSVYDEDPALILSFISATRQMSGDAYLRALDAASGHVPTFGLANSGEDESGKHTYIIGGSEIIRDGFAMLLITGDTKVRMYNSQPRPESLLSFTGTVTSVSDVIVKEINHEPALPLLAQNSIALDGMDGVILTSIPFHCTFPGDTESVCRLVANTHPDGGVEFMGEIPEGTVLKAGTITAADIVKQSAQLIAHAVRENPDARLFLISSCLGRLITLGLDTTAEFDVITEELPKDTTYLCSYVGGEICPSLTSKGLTNRYRNNSLTILALS